MARVRHNFLLFQCTLSVAIFLLISVPRVSSQSASTPAYSDPFAADEDPTFPNGDSVPPSTAPGEDYPEQDTSDSGAGEDESSLSDPFGDEGASPSDETFPDSSGSTEVSGAAPPPTENFFKTQDTSGSGAGVEDTSYSDVAPDTAAEKQSAAAEPAPAPSANGGGSGLSSGTILAIAAGVAVVVSLILLTVCICRARQRNIHRARYGNTGAGAGTIEVF